MALGFGFNKAKILSTAEKYVQQGKLQNAIAEYEKVTKADPKDLTVLNTIGDLYARLGRGDQAAEFFKRVGDAYAADGFVVKAIAMYKKLTKLNPSGLDSAVRLAELYTQQGLYNDARAQYTAVADQYLKADDRERATGVLKKMLDLDPENAAMQAKVAELYLKLGKNKEALEIYFAAAQSLHQRGSMDAADEALARVLKLDPGYAPALLLRGQIAAESGNSEVAIAGFSKLPDLDSRPDVLRPLLQAYVKTGQLDQADPIVTKLITLHNDLSGVTSYADALLAAGKSEQALRVYEQYADKLLASNREAFLESLNSAVAKVKESAPALTTMLGLLQKVGAQGHAIREVQELLAHACVQSGELQRAADLYHELSEAEPENPLHEQNYKQIISRMGKDSATRALSEEEGGQAFMVDELEAPPAIVQEYSKEIAEAITSALTDSELFSSYNVPEKAIKPLEEVLPKAPSDVRLRQRLASLYARLGRFADAANCCTALAELHSSAGLNDQAAQFREMAAKYTEQAAGVAASAPVIPAAAATAPPPSTELVSPEKPVAFEASSVVRKQTEVAPAESTVAEFDLSTVTEEELPSEPAAPAPPAHTAASAVTEAEHVEDWEEMLTVEAPAAETVEAAGTPSSGKGEVQEVVAGETPDEILEEARFYLSQRMTAEAQSAVARLEAIAPRHAALKELRSLAFAQKETPAPVSQSAGSPPAPPKEHKPTLVPTSASSRVPPKISPEDEADLAGLLEDLIPEIAAGEPASFTAPPTHVSPKIPAPSSAPAAKSAPPQPTAADPLAGMLSDLDEALGDIVAAPEVAKAKPIPAPAPAAAPQPKPTPASAPVSVSMQADGREAQSMLSDLLDEFKEGIEEPAADADDPDTHYNLGVAFREMGLIDEAISELQKVCRFLDNGVPFSQPMQAYTWLAQCLVDKGAPQAAIRWYEKALRVNGIGEDSRLAVYYDMANAYEVAGNSKAALDNFMEVYGANIDYRDVADRIRSLQK